MVELQPVSNPKRVVGSTRHTIARGMSGGVARTIILTAVNLLLVPIQISHMGTALYGFWATLGAVIAVMLLADAGMRSEVGRRIAACGGDQAAVNAVAKNGFAVLTLAAIVVLTAGMVLAPFASSLLFPESAWGHYGVDVVALFRAVVVASALGLVGNAWSGVLIGLQRLDLDAAASVIASVIAAGLTCVLLLRGVGVWSPVIGFTAESCLELGIKYRFVRRFLPRPSLSVSPGRKVLAGYLGLSTLVMIGQLGDVFDFQWDRLILAHVRGPQAVTALQLGTLYALQVKALIVCAIAPLMAASAELYLGSFNRLAHIGRTLSGIAGAASAGVLGASIVLAPSFFSLWLPADAGDASLVAQLFGVAVGFNLMAAPLAFQVIGRGAHGLAARGSLVNIALNVIASLFLTVHLGVIGALIGSILGNATGTVLFLVLVRRRLPDLWMGWTWRAQVFGTLAGAAGVVLLRGAHLGPALLLLVAAAYSSGVGLVGLCLEGVGLSTLLSRARRVASS